MVKIEGFKGFFKKTSNRDACTRLMELTLMFDAHVLCDVTLVLKITPPEVQNLNATISK